MEFKGTKGEWKITGDSIVEDGSGYISIGTDKEWWLLEAKGTHVGPKTVKQVRANAKLISCAPELLRMVKTLQFELTEAIKELQSKDYEIDFQTCHEAYELIKKATTI